MQLGLRGTFNHYRDLFEDPKHPTRNIYIQCRCFIFIIVFVIIVYLWLQLTAQNVYINYISDCCKI